MLSLGACSVVRGGVSRSAGCLEGICGREGVEFGPEHYACGRVLPVSGRPLHRGESEAPCGSPPAEGGSGLL